MSEQPDGLDDQFINDEMASMFDLKKMKKKKKKKTDNDDVKVTAEENAEPVVANIKAVEGDEQAGASSYSSLLEPDPPTYTYLQLLNRVVDFVHQVFNLSFLYSP
jgi:hypothetical protein